MGLLNNIQQGIEQAQYESSFSTASGRNYQYVVLQVTLKEKMFGTGSGNLYELEAIINQQAKKGYRLIIPSLNGTKSKIYRHPFQSDRHPFQA